MILWYLKRKCRIVFKVIMHKSKTFFIKYHKKCSFSVFLIIIVYMTKHCNNYKFIKATDKSTSQALLLHW